MDDNTNTDLSGARILIVDDEKSVLNLLCRMISRLGYKCDCADGGEKALTMAGNNSYDLVLADIRMPGINGIELVEKLRESGNLVSVIMITAVIEIDVIINALRVGAIDYILKPIELNLIKESVRRGIKAGRETRTTAEHIRKLKQNVEKSEITEREIFINTASVFVDAIESRSRFFSNHSKEVADICIKLCKQMEVPPRESQSIYIAAILHDIGNLYIEDAILEKPEKLTDAEKLAIQSHANNSVKISKSLKRSEDVKDIVRHHHERWDGTGYPDHLVSKKIPLGSRILSVGAAYVAMKSVRPFRKSLSHKKAIRELRNNSEHQFDPQVVQAFERLGDTRT